MGTRGKGYYKGQEFTFDLPEGWSLLAMAEPREVPGLADLGEAVRGLLRNPIGMAPLGRVVAGMSSRKTAIVVDDQSRPTPVAAILEPLLDELNRLGIADVDVIVGVGTHRRPSADEVRAKVGAVAPGRVRVSIHDADAPDLVYVGTTRRGTDVQVNRLVAEAALIIGIGSAAPHYFAGYGGGAKIILPGVCGRETIKQNHVWVGDPRAEVGATYGNPIWEDMLEGARLARLTFKLDAVLNTRNEVYRLFGGEVEAQQRAAVEAIKEVYGVPVPDLADVTITSGYPLESDLIQSSKAIMQAATITRPGGTIVLVSGCRDGAGPLLYETLRQRPEADELVHWIAQGRANTTSGTMASRLRALVKSKRLVVVTDGLSPQQLAEMDFGHAPSVAAAIAEIAGSNGRRNVIVLPVGGTTFSYLAEPSGVA